MSWDSSGAGSLGVADYVVFALMLVVSAAVGVYYAWTSRGKGTSREFLTGGRRLTALPVSLSLTASFMSSITVLSTPAEVYCFGAIFILSSFAYILSLMIVSEVFLPVSYRLSITSAYEYLELRFNRATRLLATILFIVQAVLYTGIVIYGPALALSQVTGLDLWGGIISTGAVCTLYCTLGGLKAVVWTDVFQMGIMFAGFLSVIIKTVTLQGGVSTIISDAKHGGRLNIWDFDMNPLRRHTFWTLTIGGTVSWIVVYGANQAQIQRYISCKSITHARLALFINLLALCLFLMCSVFAGLCLFSIFKDCDPWTSGQVSTPDQLIPYLVMGTLTSNPGLPGLFLAAVYSGALSTVSTSINALATVTLEDLIKPYTTLSEKHQFWMSKGLSLLYGVLCISLAGLASVLGGMMQAAATVGGVILGPVLGVFTLGILFPFANAKGGLSGLLSGLVASLCVGVGAVIYPSPPTMTRPLPLSTEGCNVSTTESYNWTSTAPPTESSIFIHSNDRYSLEESWHSPSYLYFSLIGTVTAITMGLIISLLTGGWREKVESRLTLMKEDTVSYHLFKFFFDRVLRRKSEIYPMKDSEMNDGNTNPAFCDGDIDLKSCIRT
ncbi:sodium-coupled monocarboxylate transporter 1-like isoform X1 [Xyrichtys novacula]|uniref:Sodium-coupled monocarboxylate transporter 1-like isoform X1 n=1 Tax=Xyrichtys novacula TaxID=13765 RepID=A0AAV1EZM7_XYRNO|nr:sodium-coupled monocarboxylate transporter 1-like isoform X1 [Xyrichtys novacula]